MSTFRVCFDGKWQGKFDTLAEASQWAQEVAETGRTVIVIERHGLRHDFRAAFPEERATEAKQAWLDNRDMSAGEPFTGF